MQPSNRPPARPPRELRPLLDAVAALDSPDRAATLLHWICVLASHQGPDLAERVVRTMHAQAMPHYQAMRAALDLGDTDRAARARAHFVAAMGGAQR